MMKPRLIAIFTSLGSAVGIAQALAGPSIEPPSASATPVDISVLASGDVIGMPVRNAQGHKLGLISNVIIGCAGNVEAAVLKTGGVLGIGESEYTVPWTRLQLVPGATEAVLYVTRRRLRSEFSAFESVRRRAVDRKGTP